MGKSRAPSPPPAPDPQAVAAAQSQANVNTAIANATIGNADEVNPYGSVHYEQTGSRNVDGKDVPQYLRTVSLAPEQQRLYDQQTAIGGSLNDFASGQLSRLGEALSRPVAGSGLPGAPIRATSTPNLRSDLATNGIAMGFANAPPIRFDVGEGARSGIAMGFADPGPIQTSVNLGQQSTEFGDAGPVQGSIGLGRFQTELGDAGEIQRQLAAPEAAAARQQVQDSLNARLNPQLAQRRTALEDQLVSQGLTRGTEAFNRAIDEVGRQENDAHLAVIGQAGQEEDRVFGQAAAKGAFTNSAQAQAYAQLLSRGQFANAGTAADNDAIATEGSFANSAQAQRYAQLLGRGQFANAAIGANNEAALASGNFANSAQQQGYLQELGRVEFNNRAQGQRFDQAMAEAGLGNSAQQQSYLQELGKAAFNNQAQGQRFDQSAAETQIGNATAQQDFGNELTLQSADATARERSLQEDLALRSQPINEIAALMNGGQVTAPQFAQYRPGVVDGTPIGQYTYQGYQGQLDAWKTQTQANAAAKGGTTGALGSVAGGIGRAATKSDRRLKRGIRDLKVRLPNGLPLYAYRYIDSDTLQIGVMADEAEIVVPAAVITAADGFKRVFYDRVV